LRWRVFVALFCGAVLCLSGHAQKWTRLGPDGGTVQSLGIGPRGEVFLGAADGHVFASKDRASWWELRGRVGSRLDAVVTRLVANERELFASVWYQQGGGGGVFQSSDAGRSWRLIGLEQEAVRALEIAPSQPQELVAGTHTGVFHSLDGGKSWTRISPPGDQEIRNIDSIAIDIRDPATIYVGTFHLPWKTTDAGKTWQPISGGVIDDSDVMSIHVDFTNPERLFMSACSGIYRTDNRGAQWTKMQGIPYSARRTQAIVQDPSNPQVLYAGTTEGLWVTRDNGESWIRTTSKDWIVNSVIVLPDPTRGRERVVLGTEGQGIQVSDDAGVTFAGANHGFTHTVVRQLVAQRNDLERLLMIVQGAGWELLQSGDGGKTWQRMPFTAVSKGKATKVSPNDVHGIYSTPWGWLVRLANEQLWKWEESRREWREWSLRLPAISLAAKGLRTAKTARTTRHEFTRMQGAAAIRAFSRDAVFVSNREGVFRCAESGICTELRAYRTGDVDSVWVSSSGSEMAIVMTRKVGLSSDGGETATWHDLPEPAAHVVSIDATGTSPERRVYLSTAAGLFVSEDAGQHWKKSGAGLPSAQIDQWLRGPAMWVATERDGGVYISGDQGATWRRADHDAERSRFTALVQAGDGTVLASSQSEGLLRLESSAQASQ
jgi:photosystem II stability/assembly factor-like uncharacterized protein